MSDTENKPQSDDQSCASTCYAFERIAAEKLAESCVKAIRETDLGSRSVIGDALLDYIHSCGFRTIPEWEARNSV